MIEKIQSPDQVWWVSLYKQLFLVLVGYSRETSRRSILMKFLLNMAHKQNSYFSQISKFYWDENHHGGANMHVFWEYLGTENWKYN